MAIMAAMVVAMAAPAFARGQGTKACIDFNKANSEASTGEAAQRCNRFV